MAISESDLHQYQQNLGLLPKDQGPTKKKNKFNAVITKVGCFTFHSADEARRYEELKLLEAGREICNLELQPVYELTDVNGKIIRYVADFRYFDRRKECIVVEDVKSKATRTRLFILKKALMKEKYNIDVVEIYYR